MAVDREDTAPAIADFVADDNCAVLATTAHFHMAAVPDRVNGMYDLLVDALLFADIVHFEKILLFRLPVHLSSLLLHL